MGCLDCGLVAQRGQSKVRVPGRRLCRQLRNGPTSQRCINRTRKDKQELHERRSLVLSLSLLPSTNARTSKSNRQRHQQNTMRALRIRIQTVHFGCPFVTSSVYTHHLSCFPSCAIHLALVEASIICLCWFASDEWLQTERCDA